MHFNLLVYSIPSMALFRPLVVSVKRKNFPEASLVKPRTSSALIRTTAPIHTVLHRPYTYSFSYLRFRRMFLSARFSISLLVCAFPPMASMLEVATHRESLNSKPEALNPCLWPLEDPRPEIAIQTGNFPKTKENPNVCAGRI